MQVIALGLIAGSIYALIALGINLVYKTSRVLNFAQAEVGTLTLYATWWISSEHHLPWIVGALASIALAVAIGLFFERSILRPIATASRVTLAVATIGLFSLMVSLELTWFAGTIKELPPPLTQGGFQIAGVFISGSEELAVVVAVCLAAGLGLFLRYTDFGLAVLASADDPIAAQLMGVPRAHVSAFTWGVAGALSAVACLLIEPTIGVLAPGVFAGLFIGGLTAALVGGLTSLPGAVVGGMVVGVVEAAVKGNVNIPSIPSVQSVAMLVIVLAFLLLRPRGILGANVGAEA